MLQRFVLRVLDRAPEYFWTLPASTSGRRHGAGETLVEHVIGCLDLAESVCEQLEAAKAWGPTKKDQLRAALALHDCWRCGPPGQERRYPPDHERAGDLRTCPSHPEVGFIQILEIWERETVFRPPFDTIVVVAEAVRSHSGPWTVNPFVRFDTAEPFSSVAMQTHNIDHMHAHMMRIRRAG